jgi:hypothetical protein
MVVQVDVEVEFVDVDLRNGNKDRGFRAGRQTAVLSVFAKVAEELQLEVVVDVIGEGIEVTQELLKVQSVVGENEEQVNLRTDVTFPVPVKKIADTVAEVKIKRRDTKVIPDKVIVQGILKKQIFFVDLCNGSVLEKSVEEPFTTFVDVPGAEEDMNVQIREEVEFVDHAKPDYPDDICRRLPGCGKDPCFDPDEFPWKQTAIVAIFAKVTETLQLDVVTDVQEVAVPTATPTPTATPCPPGSTLTRYQIQRGDTLFMIARRFNTTVDAILAQNPGIDPNNLQVGTFITICAGQAPLG